MSPHHRLPVIGLVGGVGSGKSTLARALAEQRTIIVLDGDAIGHQVLDKPDVVQRIRTRFGEGVFTPSDKIDRALLAREVFGTEKANALSDLESIVHPQIRKALIDGIEDARIQATADAVLMDAAVLFEAGWNDLCDIVVFIDVPFEVRLQRVGNRNWNEEELRKREASQWPIEKKRAAADFTIDHSIPPDQAAKRLSEIIDHVEQCTGDAENTADDDD